MGPHSITSSSHHLSKSLVPAGESKFAGSPSKYRNFGLWSRVKLRRANYFAYQASPSFWATGLIQTGQCTDTGGSVNPALSGPDPSAGGTTRALKSSPSFQFGEASPGRILRLAVERVGEEVAKGEHPRAWPQSSAPPPCFFRLEELRAGDARHGECSLEILTLSPAATTTLHTGFT